MKIRNAEFIKMWEEFVDYFENSDSELKFHFEKFKNEPIKDIQMLFSCFPWWLFVQHPFFKAEVDKHGTRVLRILRKNFNKGTWAAISFNLKLDEEFMVDFRNKVYFDLR